MDLRERAVSYVLNGGQAIQASRLYKVDDNPIEQTFAVIKKPLRFSGRSLEKALSHSSSEGIYSCAHGYKSYFVFLNPLSYESGIVVSSDG